MVIKRIENDIFNNAKKMGYKNIWFVGFSLGGLNSLLFYKEYANEICGVVLLAPYLADKVLTKEIQKMDGIKNWQSGHLTNVTQVNEVNHQLDHLWMWLKEQDKKNYLDKIFLGYGNQDRYVESHKILSDLLPRKNIMSIEGEHGWKTGRKLWQKQLISWKQTGLLKPCR